MSNEVKKTVTNQVGFLAPTLKGQLNPKQELYLLSEVIQWPYFDDAFLKYYSKEGRPAHSIRLMTSLPILKQLYDLSD